MWHLIKKPLSLANLKSREHGSVFILHMLSAFHTIPFPFVRETRLWLMLLQQPVKNVTTNYSLDHSKLKIDFFHLPDGCLIGNWAGSHFRLWLNDSGQYLWLLPDRGHWRKLKHSPMLHLWQKNKFLTGWYIKGGILGSGQNPDIAAHLKQACQALPLVASKAKLAISSLDLYVSIGNILVLPLKLAFCTQDANLSQSSFPRKQIT